MNRWHGLPPDVVDMMGQLNPNGNYSGREVAALVHRIFVERGEYEVSTTLASEILGHSSDWWKRQAKAGKIAGAYQAGPGAPWTLPLQACREHLRSLRQKGKARERTGKHFGRKPWPAPEIAA